MEKKHTTRKRIQHKTPSSPSFPITQEGFRTIFEQSPVSTQIFSSDGTTIAVNKAWEKLWGAPGEAVVGMYNILKDKQLIEKNVMQGVKKAFQGEPAKLPTIKYVPSQTIGNIGAVAYRILSASIYPVKDPGGSVREVVLIHEDITDRVNYEQNLQESEERYRNLVEMAPDVIYSIYPDGTLRSLTPAFETLTGWKVKDWVGKNFAGLIHPDDLPFAIKKFKEGLRKKIQEPYELRIKKSDGTCIYGEFRSGPLIEGGKVVAKVGVARDISKRKIAEQELERSRTQMEVVLQGVADGISMQDASGKLIYINDTGARASGFRSAKDMMANLTPARMMEYEMIDAERKPFPLDMLPGRRALRGELKPEAIVGYRDKKSGDIRWSMVKSRPVMAKDGRVLFVINIFHDITSIRRTEEQLEFQANVLSSVTDSVIVTDLKGKIIYWNKGAERIFGYRKKEMIGKTPAMLYPEYNHTRYAEDLREIRAGKEYRSEWKGRKKDGSTVWVDIKTTLLTDSSGKASGFIGIAKDISLRKHAEEALRVSEERYRLLVETTNVIPWESDVATGAFTYVGPQAEKMLGYPAEEWYGKTFWPDHIHPDDRKWVIDYCLESCRKRNHYEFEYRMVKKDGKAIWLRDVVSVIREKGKPLKLRGFMIDITQIKEVNERLENLAAIVASSDDAIISRTLDGKVISWNKGSEKLYGYTEKDMVGKNVSMLIPKGKKYELKALTDSITQSKGVRHIETVRQRKDGSLVEVSITLSPIKDSSGRTVGISAIARDISQRRAIERQKDAFIGIASHELKTPVTSLKAYAQVLQRRFARSGNNEASDQIEKMIVQLDKLTNLISDLLDVTKIETGKMQFYSEKFDFRELVHEIIEEMQRTTDKHSIQIAEETKAIVRGDRERIGQVLVNLLSNAIKYSPQADKIDVSIAQSAGEIVCCVKDYGVGIADKNKEKVFERFFRASEPGQDTYPGLGLGLFISSEIVKRHNGKIWVKSKRGKGTTFCFSLPIADKKLA